MATVKTQSGNVILKNGKVSCECCDVECCMYPSSRLANGFYTNSDLPNAVTINDISYNRVNESYGNTTNGVILEGEVWAKYQSGTRSIRSCLIQGGVQDQFKDEYIATVRDFDGSVVPSAIIYRESLGIWRGTQSCGKRIELVYFGCVQGGIPPGINTNPLWALSWDFCNPPPDSQTGTTQFKSGSQGDPVGSYPGSSGEATISIL